ncbi:MAG: DMT family transporter [Chloroflexi bacterium]|nr:DMT family transporter [Chloroflexota bacterium]
MKRILPYIQITGAMAIVGSNIVVGKLIAVSFPLFIATTLRFALALIILLPLVLKMERKLPTVRKKDLLFIFLLAFAGNFLYSIFLLYGLKLTTAAESGIISGTAPVVTAALSYLFLRERIGRNKVVGIALVILGIIIINLAESPSHGATRSLLGDLLICGSVVAEALWTTFGKAVSSKVSPLVLASLTIFFGFVMFLPLGIYQSIGFPLTSLPLTSWLAVAYYGLVGTVGAYLLWYQGMPKVPASTVGVFTGLVPVSAVLLSYILLKEPFVWSHPLGMLCVLIAIVCITISPPDGSSQQQKS